MKSNETDQEKLDNKKSTHSQAWPEWYKQLKKYQHPDRLKGIWQIVNTLIPYLFLWYLMVRSIQLGYPYFVTLLLAFPAAAFLIRIFILFHDCVHGSFFESKRANAFFGYLFGILVFTSFEDWKFCHLRHHVSYGNLDERGFGDIRTITLDEYSNLSKSKQLNYRLYRNPLIMILIGGLYLFLIQNRFPSRGVTKKEKRGTLFTNLLIAAAAVSVSLFIGWKTYLLVQIPVLWLAGAAGIWLFYVQHQFPGGYWARKKDWSRLRAAMEGSSFYKLPALLRWFSGSIGYHHVHHLSPRIPNYLLKKCYDAVPELKEKEPVAFMESLSFIKLKLWDENLKKMIVFP
ncbi:MAG: fatty acid desaturase [Spirochaetia bacterium]|jgi:omega-6 fatty acid desaturase (delta-12 desaturase)|nr:fatty acid desaturase [Spirochaetia bacterium]